jgi:hypothetical protein
MSKTFAGLTIEELNAAGAAAGAEALAKTHAAGLPAAGMTRLRFMSGEEAQVLTYLHPDGRLEIADARVHFNQKPSFVPEEMESVEAPTKSLGTAHVTRSSNNGRFVETASSVSGFNKSPYTAKKKAS